MRLEIYVSEHCANCQEALRIAAEARRIPCLEVSIIDLDDRDRVVHPVPSGVVAVPTYLLDGHTISLGNPEPATFLRTLAFLAQGSAR